MAINWGLLQTPDFSQAVLGGMEAGRRVARSRQIDAALSQYSTNPKAAVGALIGAGAIDQAAALDRMSRDERRSALLGRVMAPASPASPGAVLTGSALPTGAAPVGQQAPADRSRVVQGPAGPNTLGAYLRRQQQPSQPAAEATPLEAPTGPMGALDGYDTTGAPEQLVDPAHLPARTDGMRLNQEALRQLYAEDPEAAHQIQTWAYSANKQQFEQAQQRGQIMGNVAFKLLRLPDAERADELRAYAPYLEQYGFTPETIGAADLSDAGLNRYLTMAQTYNSLVDDDRQERRLSADLDNMEADNARADRDTNDRMRDRELRRGLTARGQNLSDARGRYGIDVASRDRQRGQDIASADRRRGQDMRPAPKGRASANAPVPSIKTKAEYAALPSGSVFVGPDGQQRKKP